MYVYYADSFRSKFTHWIVSLFIAAGAIMSALFITMVNAWMNTPNGFNMAVFIQTGKVTGVDAYAPFITSSTLAEVFHVLVTTLFAGSMLTTAYFAWRQVRSSDHDERIMLGKGLKITVALGVIMIMLSGVSGSHAMGNLLLVQPMKFAALEGDMNPGTNLPDRFFGIISNGQITGGITLPGMQSFLAQLETGTTQLPGLSQFPSSAWPPLVVYYLFFTMVVGGLLLAAFSLVYVLGWIFKKRPFESRPMSYTLMIMGLLAFLIYEIGWVIDEVGRQPWIVYNVMTVSQAANYTSSLFVARNSDNYLLRLSCPGHILLLRKGVQCQAGKGRVGRGFDGEWGCELLT